MKESFYISCLKECKTKNEFKEIWNSLKHNFDWFYSDLLCIYCNKYIDIWWNPDKFDWGFRAWLHNHCSDSKNIWYKDYIKFKLKKDW